MKVHRPGTTRRIVSNLRRHDELMQKYIAEGMEVCAASERAFAELFGRKPAVQIREVKP